MFTYFFLFKLESFHPLQSTWSRSSGYFCYKTRSLLVCPSILDIWLKSGRLFLCVFKNSFCAVENEGILLVRAGVSLHRPCDYSICIRNWYFKIMLNLCFQFHSLCFPASQHTGFYCSGEKGSWMVTVHLSIGIFMPQPEVLGSLNQVPCMLISAVNLEMFATYLSEIPAFICVAFNGAYSLL